MPKISVIMPVYNTCEEHLRGAVESILSQTFQDFEFLIVDDGSKNNAQEVIKSYCDKRIRLLINEQNKGLIFSLNTALEKAEGEFIARMDSDDVALPLRFEKQLEYLEQNPDVALSGASMQYFDSSSRVFLAPLGFSHIKFAMLFENAIAHPTVMFRAEAFKKLRYSEEFKCAEDYELWTRALSQGLRFENLGEILLNYRIHKGQVGSKHNSLQVQNATKARRAYLLSLEPNFTEKELDILINLTNPHKRLFMASSKEYEAVLKKLVRANIKKKFFDSRELLKWTAQVSNELKYPKIRLFSLKVGKTKHTLYFAHPKSEFLGEKKIFNALFVLTREA